MNKQNKIPLNVKYSPENDRLFSETSELDINNTHFDSRKDYQVHKNLLGSVNEAWAYEDTRRGIGKLAARHATRKAFSTYDKHNAMIKNAYSKDGGLANEFAYDDALRENEQYDLNISLGEMADDLSKELAKEKEEANFKSLGNFDKLNFIFNFAQGLSQDKKVPYIKTDRNSVAINGSYLTYEYLSIGLKSYGDKQTVTSKVETRIIKCEDNSFEIDFTKVDNKYKNWKDIKRLTDAYDRRDYDDVNRKGLTIAVKEVLSKEKPLSDKDNIKRDAKKPYKKILLNSDGSASILSPNSYRDLPSGSGVFSATGEEIPITYGDYKVDKTVAKENIKDLIDLMSETWIHGVVMLPGLA